MLRSTTAYFALQPFTQFPTLLYFTTRRDVSVEPERILKALGNCRKKKNPCFDMTFACICNVLTLCEVYVSTSISLHPGLHYRFLNHVDSYAYVAFLF